MTNEEILSGLYTTHFGTVPECITALAVSGSDRRYYRLSAAGKTAIGTINNIVNENNTYFYFTELFRKHDIKVPEVYIVSKDHKAYLQQDLGSVSLFDKLQQDGYTDEVKKLYARSLEQLARVQWIAGRDTDFHQCYGTSRFDENAVMADLNYFKYYFADLQKMPYDRAVLNAEMTDMSRELGRIQPLALMYRDFQSRNIMLHDGEVYFIDYRGSMQGPPQYDIASLLWQAKAGLPAAWKDELFTHYITIMHSLPVPRIDELYFRRGYAQVVLLRLIQVLGAYGFRGLLERKPHFLSSIVPALDNLKVFLSDYPQLPAYPEMRSLLERLSAGDIQKKYAAPQLPEESRLTITVNSFSYKNGLPKDDTSHGGGYIFDCRGLLNPGRYKAYKHLSGKDKEVKSFLEGQTKMPEFLEHVFSLVSLNVTDYISRGFEHLSISFGCTGGQHRSVYAAERTADYLRKTYGVEVNLRHLNEARWVREPKSE